MLTNHLLDEFGRLWNARWGGEPGRGEPLLSERGAGGHSAAFCWPTTLVQSASIGRYDLARDYHTALERRDPATIRWHLLPLRVVQGDLLHWVLVVLDTGMHTIHVYDSSSGARGGIRPDPQHLGHLRDWHDRLLLDRPSWARNAGVPIAADEPALPAGRAAWVVHYYDEPDGMPQQGDGVSCGCYTVGCMADICAGRHWSFGGGLAGDAELRRRLRGVLERGADAWR